MLHALLPDFSVCASMAKTRHEPDPNPVLRGDFAGKGD